MFYDTPYGTLLICFLLETAKEIKPFSDPSKHSLKFFFSRKPWQVTLLYLALKPWHSIHSCWFATRYQTSSGKTELKPTGLGAVMLLGEAKILIPLLVWDNLFRAIGYTWWCRTYCYFDYNMTPVQLVSGQGDWLINPQPERWRLSLSLWPMRDELLGRKEPHRSCPHFSSAKVPWLSPSNSNVHPVSWVTTLFLNSILQPLSLLSFQRGNPLWS